MFLDHLDAGAAVLGDLVDVCAFEQPEAKGLAFAVYDPSFFIAFDLAKTDQPVRLGEGAPKGCALKIGAPDRNPNDVSALGESLTAITGFGVSVAKTVSVECSGQ